MEEAEADADVEKMEAETFEGDTNNANPVKETEPEETEAIEEAAETEKKEESE